uniref:BPTI/Kunitz inhibitor domain-containing protein n=1 Tax=Haemonchus contortus TaxID=6289 RepID=A0A7I4YTW8_HAECO
LETAVFFEANLGRSFNESTEVRMITLMYRLTVFGLLSSCIRAEYDYEYGDEYQALVGERPFRPANPRSPRYSKRRYPFQSRHDYGHDYSFEQGDCNSCKEIEDACSTYEDYVKCHKPSVVYTAARCLHAEVECESSADVRMESEHGHAMTVGRRGTLYANCENGMWTARDAWNKDFVFSSLSCLPERARNGWPEERYVRLRRYRSHGDRLAPRNPCNYSVDLGDIPCDRDATIRYHFDAETMTCLPFKYTGCGGNANNFYSQSGCRHRCIPMDHLKCPANSPPVRRPDGTASCFKKNNECPKGSSCQVGWQVGICCDNKDLENYNKNIHPDCGGRKVVKEDHGGFKLILLGKSCQHQFCPKGTECRRGAFYAYCCQ